MTREQILTTINLIRWSHSSMVRIYTEGGCFQFYKILKSLCPDAVAVHYEGHVYAKIDGKYYDINGEYQPGDWSERALYEMREVDMIKAEEWVRVAFNKDRMPKEETL